MQRVVARKFDLVASAAAVLLLAFASLAPLVSAGTARAATGGPSPLISMGGNVCFLATSCENVRINVVQTGGLLPAVQRCDAPSDIPTDPCRPASPLFLLRVLAANNFSFAGEVCIPTDPCRQFQFSKVTVNGRGHFQVCIPTDPCFGSENGFDALSSIDQ